MTRSRSFRALWLGAFLFLCSDCDNRNDLISMICETLDACTDFPEATGEKCRTELTDAITDGRMTRAGLTRCSTCIERQGDSREENCPKWIEDRDCDAACEEVDFVLKAQTQSVTREEMCTNVTVVCGNAPEPNDCKGEVDTLYAGKPLSDQLAVDAEVAACMSCVRPSAASDVDSVVPSLVRCGSLIELCATTCADVEPIGRRLELARSLLTMCNKVEGCFELVNQGTGGEGGANQVATSDSSGDALTLCFYGYLDKSNGTAPDSGLTMEDALRNCAECAELNSECEALVQNCRAKCDEVIQ